MPKLGHVLFLTHICDCGAIFDRYRVRWSIRANVGFSIRFCMDYEDIKGVKPDRIWLWPTLGASNIGIKRVHFYFNQIMGVFIFINKKEKKGLR